MEEKENKLLISGDIEGWKKSQKPRQPKEASEGVDTTRAADIVELGGAGLPRKEYLGAPPGAVSLTKITVADLLSEGLIDGLVTGYHTYVGTAGNTGWTTAAITNYLIAPNTTVRWLPSVYWNQVPVVNPNNQFNFQNVTVNFTPGLPNGSTSAQISTEAVVVRSIGERLRYGPDFVKIYRILNKNIKAVDVNVRFNQLSQSVTAGDSAGDLIESEVRYNISYRPLYSQGSLATSAFTTPALGQEIVRGKISFGYIRKTRINLATANQNFTLEPDFLGWEIKVERMTLDSTTSAIRNQTFLDSILEVYGDVFSYPNSAIVNSQFSAEFFSQVPVRHYEVKGLKVQIPSNYSPLTRTYSPNIGNDWDGTFKTNADGTVAKEWTDNPAWCYFDLLTNRNYGLGKYITGNDISVDKWTLYDIGRYCDVLVSDGFGSLEPRLSCNVVLNSREEAFKVVNDMASIFRGMAYYGAGTVYTVQDSPKNPYLLFTNANVENGDFAYSSSSRRVRHTVAIVRYNDKKNYYKPAIEYVEDVDGIRRYGIREIELIGFGCTSRGQAVRLGRWALLSETTETETINFTAGLDGAIVRPGDVIQISDRNKRGTRYGGRTYQIVNPSTITLDSEIPGLVATNLYNFHVVTPTWNYDPILTDSLLASDISGIRKPHVQTQTFRGNQATSILGNDDVNRSQIAFSDPFDTGNYYLSGQLIWMVDSSGTSDVAYNIIDNYRVVNINEKEPHKYVIAGVQYNVNKYNQIESGLNFGTQSIIDTAPPGPVNLVLDLQPLAWVTPTQATNSKKIHYTFALPATVSAESAASISKYLVYVKPSIDFVDPTDVAGNTYLINVLPANKLEGDYIPPASDRYFFRVYSATANNTKSTTYAPNDKLVTNLNPISDIIVQSLRLDSESQVFESTTTPTLNVNDPGSRQIGTYTTSDPTFVWQVGFQSNALINVNMTGLGYRVTIRKPSDTSTPSPVIYWGPNNLPVQLTGKFSNLSYTFPFSDNKLIAIPDLQGPVRDFDIVVEAVNTHDKTSAAGGAYENPVGTPVDTTFKNSFSYDIFGATNPPIDDFMLTDTTKNPAVFSLYDTEQWITTDGSIKLLVKKNIPPDWEGGVAYVWTGLNVFEEREVNAKFVIPNNPSYGTTNKNIIRIPFIGSGENGLMTIPTGITGYLSAYMSVRPVDSFDLARFQNGILRDDQVKMSNIVKIQKRLGFNDKVLYKAWAETEINYHNQNIAPDWTNYAVGIKSITCEPYNDVLDNNATKFKWNFDFDVPLPNTNYVVAATNTGVHVVNNSQIIKYVDKVQFYRFVGKQFFGVLYNGNDASVV